VDSHSDWFSEEVTKRIGDGYSTSFWFDPWVDGVPLQTHYQGLFQVSDQCLDRVIDIGIWVRGEWEFRWKSNINMLDQELFTDLLETLREVRFSSTKDEWVWGHDPSGLFWLNQPTWFLKIKLGFLEISRGPILLFSQGFGILGLHPK
jgi:hypothetical protein